MTLNPLAPPAPEKVIKRLSLAHPAFSFDSYRAQERVPQIQGTGGVFFAGARSAWEGVTSGATTGAGFSACRRAQRNERHTCWHRCP